MITTNFYNDLKEVKDAKEKLIKNLNATSDIKYDNSASMITLANGVLNRNNTLNSSTIDYTEDKDHYWEERPSWYPDTKSILNNASDITVDGTTYYPLYILLIDGVHSQDYFNKTHSTSSSSVSNYNGSGGDAYLFSDTYDPLADNEGLEIGTAIVHKWNIDKDITDTSDVKSKRLRWVIVYGTSKTTTTKVVLSYSGDAYYFRLPVIEFISGECTFEPTTYTSFGFYGSKTLKYACFQDNTVFKNNDFGYNSASYSAFTNCYYLESLIFPEGVTRLLSYSTQYSALKNCFSLTYIKIPSTVITIGQAFFYYCKSLPFIKIPDGCGMYGSPEMFYYCSNLKEIDISKLSLSAGGYFGFYHCDNLRKIINGENLLYCSSCAKLEEVSSAKFSSMQSCESLTGAASSDSTVSYTNIQHLTCTHTNHSISYNPRLETIVFDVSSGTVSSSIGECYNLKNVYYKEGVTSIQTTCGTNIDYVKIPTTTLSISSNGGNIAAAAKYTELWQDFDIACTLGNNSYYKSAEWFKDLCVWLKNNTGLTTKTIALGSYNLEVMKQIYLTYNPDNVNEITWVEQGTDGAINIVEYITGVKNWTLS